MDDFLVVEVKGLQERTGNLSLTPKEYYAAVPSESFFSFRREELPGIANFTKYSRIPYRGLSLQEDRKE
jgi:hypothetical protein